MLDAGGFPAFAEGPEDAVEAELRQGLERIVVAAVGLIVVAEPDAIGVQVNVTPRDNKFFMKPLVRELAAALTRRRKG